MAMFNRLKGLKENYDTRRSEEKAISQDEAKLMKDYNLKKTNVPGTYIAGEQVISLNVRNKESISAARDVLDKRDLSPTLKKVSKKELVGYSEGVGISGKMAQLGNAFDGLGDYAGNSGIGNMDLIGGGGIGNYDFFGGGSSQTKKRTTKRKRKTTSRRKR